MISYGSQYSPVQMTATYGSVEDPGLGFVDGIERPFRDDGLVVGANGDLTAAYRSRGCLLFVFLGHFYGCGMRLLLPEELLEVN